MKTENALQQLGERIRHLRISQELKQTDLAASAAVNKNTVLAVENGRPVSTEKLQAILAGLGHERALADLLPAPAISPFELAKLHGRERRRVR